MPHPFHAHLVVAYAKDVGSLTYRLEMIVLVATAVMRQGQAAFFRMQQVKFEFPDFNVEPAGLEEIAEAQVCGFNVERSRLVRRGHEQEADVLCQRSSRQDVQPRIVKTVRCNLSLSRVRPKGTVNRHSIGAFPVPLRRGSERHRPLGWLLKDGS